MHGTILIPTQIFQQQNLFDFPKEYVNYFKGLAFVTLHLTTKVTPCLLSS